MNDSPLIPVILAGGIGSRLWPLSRESYPKQFCAIFGKNSLLQETALRAKAITGHEKLIIITREEFYFLCRDQLSEIGITQATYLLEPVGRNTAPAIAIAAHYILSHHGPMAQLLVLPSDHLISDPFPLKEAIEKASTCEAKNSLFVFGIKPHAPKTAFGYIEKGEALAEGIFSVSNFIEKPTLEKAQCLLSNEGYYWNSGMFLFNLQIYLHELAAFAPDIAQKAAEAFTLSLQKNDFLRINRELFTACRDESIDYAVMEKTTKAVLIPLYLNWHDLGSWESLADSALHDEQQNVVYGNAIVKDSKNCFIHTENQFVAVMGLENKIIVSTPDALLVTDKSNAQAVKALVTELKSHKNSIAEIHAKVYRPWGYYQALSVGEGYQVKKIKVNPGAKLSLQMHYHRAEHWVVVQGEAEVRKGNEKFRLTTNQSTYIEKETLHRLSNPTQEPLYVIEVQSGNYLGEDDIVRMEDVYERETISII